MASGGHQHYSQLSRDPETAASGCETSAQVDTPVESSSRVGGHQTEQGTPGEWEAEEGESEQPSSLTDNLSQRVQDVVGAENERGAGDDPNNYPLHSTWTFWFDRLVHRKSASCCEGFSCACSEYVCDPTGPVGQPRRKISLLI